MDKNFDVIIIGSGPAGLTAAIYCTRAVLSTLVLAGTSWGGQLMLTTEVENFPGFPRGVMGPELMQKMREQAERFGAEILNVDAETADFGKVNALGQGEFKATGEGKTYQSRSVIIATGAQAQWLGLPSEQRLIGRGVSSCAPCDAPFFKEKNVIVVGGGDAAMEEALVLTKFAREVSIVHRRDAFRASQIMQQKVLNNPKIKVIISTVSPKNSYRAASSLSAACAKPKSMRSPRNSACLSTMTPTAKARTSASFPKNLRRNSSGAICRMPCSPDRSSGVMVWSSARMKACLYIRSASGGDSKSAD